MRLYTDFAFCSEYAQRGNCHSGGATLQDVQFDAPVHLAVRFGVVGG